MSQPTVGTDRARPRQGGPRLACVVTEVLAPAPMAVGLLTLVAWHSATTTPRAVVAAAIAVLFGAVLPFGYLLLGVRRGSWANHHVPAREQRRRPLLVGLASVLVGLALLMALGAAREMLALVGAMVAGLVVSVAITQVWKMSIHAGVAAGTAVILVLVYGPVAVVTWPFVALVAWSRVALGDHTLAQVTVGCAVGATVAGVVFSVLR